MNAPLQPEVLLRDHDDGQWPLPLAAEGVQRYVWESRFGSMLIEVIGTQVSVNGSVVEPASDGKNSDLIASSDSVRVCP